MVTFDLMAFIKRERDKGVLIDKITEVLLLNGWALADIISAYKLLKIEAPGINNFNAIKEEPESDLIPLTPYTFSSSGKNKK